MNNSSNPYILDTSSIIAAYHEIYGEAVFPGVWSNIESGIEKGKIWFPPQVVQEIEKKDDALKERIHELVRKSPVTPTSEQKANVEAHVAKLAPAYPLLAKKQGSADLHVIAWGKVLNGIIITQENPKAETKIPAACRKEKMSNLTIYGMMMNEEWRFINDTMRR